MDFAYGFNVCYFTARLLNVAELNVYIIHLIFDGFLDEGFLGCSVFCFCHF
ncbi:hypothetical protein D9M71_686180 [compost metagenome]